MLRSTVALPPRSAPSARAHHSDWACSPPPSAATRSATTGLIVATYGMLSTSAEITADPHSSPTAAPARRPSAASAATLDSCADRAGVDQRADHDEQAGEEDQGWPLDVSGDVFGVEAGQGQQQQSANHCHHGWFQVQNGVEDEGHGDRGRARRG